MDFYSNRYVWFDKNLPFTPKYCELIYVETEYNRYLNDFFRKLRLPASGWEVSYLPKISESLTVEHLAYMFPYLHDLSLEDCQLPITCDTLLSHLLSESAGIIRQGLIEYDEADDKGLRFKYIEILPNDYKRLSRIFDAYSASWLIFILQVGDFLLGKLAEKSKRFDIQPAAMSGR